MKNNTNCFGSQSFTMKASKTYRYIIAVTVLENLPDFLMKSFLLTYFGIHIRPTAAHQKH